MTAADKIEAARLEHNARQRGGESVMHGNIVKPRGLSAFDAIREPTLVAGAEDWRAGRPFRPDADLPPLRWCKDTMSNRQRIYEVGRLAAAFCRHKRRTLNESALRAAKKEGYLI